MIHDQAIYAGLAGALEPGDAAELALTFALNPAAAARRAALTQALDALLAEVDPPAWTPALFASGGRLDLSLRAPAVMDAAPSSTLALRVPLHEAQLDHWVLVLVQEEGEGAWSVELPRSPQERVRLDELPRDADGHAVIDLVRGPKPRRFAMALLPQTIDADWSAEGAERWAEVREAIAAGRGFIGVVEVPARG